MDGWHMMAPCPMRNSVTQKSRTGVRCDKSFRGATGLAVTTRTPLVHQKNGSKFAKFADFISFREEVVVLEKSRLIPSHRVLNDFI